MDEVFKFYANLDIDIRCMNAFLLLKKDQNAGKKKLQLTSLQG